jgi:ABC-type molybdate transport system substrate-binding protein
MNKSRRSAWIFIFAITMLVAFPSPSHAQVRVLISGGFSAAYQELLPQFEKSTGITVTSTRGASQGDGPTTISAQLRPGQPADVVIMSREGLAELLAEGRIVIGSDVDLAHVCRSAHYWIPRRESSRSQWDGCRVFPRWEEACL